MKPKTKRIMIGTVVICVIGAGIFTGVSYMNNRDSVEVTPVSMLNIGYYENPLSSSGMVTDAQNQSVYADGTKVITEVFVSEGQQVHAGDALLSYDLTSLNLAVELSRLETDRIANNITLAQHELEQLQQIIPDPEVEEEPDTPSEPVLPQAAEKDEHGARAHILSLTEADNAIMQQVFSYCQVADTDENTIGVPDENTQWVNERPQAAEGSTIYYRLTVTYHNGNTKTSDPAVLNEDMHEDTLIETTGTVDNPYTFLLQDNGIVYGKVINEAKDLGGKTYLSFVIKDEAGEIITDWLIRSDTFPACADTDGFDVKNHILAESISEEPVVEQQPMSGYTASQLARAIRDQKQEIRRLNLELKKAQLKLDGDRDALSDGVVYARRDGIVRKVSDPSSPPQDGSAFLEVASGTGMYVSGFVSELVYDRVNVGDTVTGYSWNTGKSVTASVISKDDYPTSVGYYNGEGNPNASYYAFEAYIEDTENVQSGDYLELTIGEAVTDSSLWISRAYIRKDNQGHYAMKDDNGKLVRQNVKVGRTVWGEYYEILEGLRDGDSIAFPYGKNVKEGKPTVQQSMEDMYG